jgi:thiamine kinase-like enzyme
MLIEDGRLPFLSMAWSPAKMAEFFNVHVFPTLNPLQQVAGLTIEDMTYVAGTKCEILYAVQFRGSSEGPSRWVVVSFRRSKRLQKIFTRHYGESKDASLVPTPRPAVYLPDYRCLVELFPWDWELPSLARAMDSPEIEPFLTQADWHASASRRLRAQVLRYRPHRRCVLRYVLESPQSPHPQVAIGKVYPPGSRAAQAWCALNTLHPQADAELIVPRPLGLINDRSLVLMESVPGASVKQVLDDAATTRSQAREATRLVAKALAKFHSLKIETQQSWTIEAQLDQFRKTNARIHLVAPRLADRIDAILEQLAPLARRLNFKSPSCIHGDCQPSQFLIDEGRIAMVDLDCAGWGDAALDVGNFMAAMHQSAVQGPGYLRELASYFLAEYEQCSPQDGLGDRARVFQVGALARMAIHSFRRSPLAYGRDDSQSLPALLVQEAETCLAGL